MNAPEVQEYVFICIDYFLKFKPWISLVKNVHVLITYYATDCKSVGLFKSMSRSWSFGTLSATLHYVTKSLSPRSWVYVRQCSVGTFYNYISLLRKNNYYVNQ